MFKKQVTKKQVALRKIFRNEYDKIKNTRS